MMRRLVVAFCVAGLLVGCSGPTVEPEESPTAMPTTPIPITDLKKLGQEESPGSAPVTATPVAVGEQAQTGQDVAISVVSAKGVTAEPGNPNEGGGPGVALTIRIFNGSNKTVDPSRMSVELEDSKGIIAAETTGSPAVEPQSELLPGQNVTAVKVFLVPEDSRSKVIARIFWNEEAPILVFEGPVK